MTKQVTSCLFCFKIVLLIYTGFLIGANYLKFTYLLYSMRHLICNKHVNAQGVVAILQNECSFHSLILGTNIGLVQSIILI